MPAVSQVAYTDLPFHKQAKNSFSLASLLTSTDLHILTLLSTWVFITLTANHLMLTSAVAGPVLSTLCA